MENDEKRDEKDRKVDDFLISESLISEMVEVLDSTETHMKRATRWSEKYGEVLTPVLDYITEVVRIYYSVGRNEDGDKFKNKFASLIEYIEEGEEIIFSMEGDIIKIIMNEKNFIDKLY